MAYPAARFARAPGDPLGLRIPAELRHSPGYRIKTLPSRLDARDLARLAAAGACPAGPPPLPPASGEVIEVERTVNASGNVSLAITSSAPGSR